MTLGRPILLLVLCCASNYTGTVVGLLLESFMELCGVETCCRRWGVNICSYFRLQNTKIARKQFVKLQRCNNERGVPTKMLSQQSKLPTFSIKCSRDGERFVSETETHKSAIVDDKASLLKKKAEEIALDLKGTCIFFVGMMGSGKAAVGRMVSEVLGYYFFDSDKLVEEAAGGASVAQSFREQDEEGFRDSESEVLRQLSSMCRLVVSTGDGAVIRPKNWDHMRHGITIWLDMPLEALASGGIESQPLLGQPTTSSYSQALARLTKLYEERGEAYSNADAKVSLQIIASEHGYEDVTALTPTIIAIEVFKAIGKLVRYKKLMRAAAAP